MKTRKEQLEIELAFENGAKIELKRESDNSDTWYLFNTKPFYWENTDYRIKEEPQRVPFDGTDAFNLIGQKFRSSNDDSDVYLCVHANFIVVTLSDVEVRYEALAKYWLKWNDLLKVWEECSKVK
jgi:hypothetical protein